MSRKPPVKQFDFNALEALANSKTQINYEADIAFQNKQYREAIQLTLQELKIKEQLDQLYQRAVESGVVLRVSSLPIHIIYWRLGKCYLNLKQIGNAKGVFKKVIGAHDQYAAMALNDLISIYQGEAKEKKEVYQYAAILEEKKLIQHLEDSLKCSIYLLLARMYRFGRAGKKPDIGNSECYYEKAALYSKAIHMEWSGLYLGDEFPKAKNDALYLKHLRKAVREDQPEAHHILACNYDEGLHGLQKNPEKALYHFKAAAEGGYVSSIYNYGYMLLNGEGALPDPINGYALVKQAALSGHSKARKEQASCLSVGRGVEQNTELAEQLFLAIIQEEDCEMAMHNLACLYLSSKRYREAREFEQKAAYKGYAPAHVNLAWMHETGVLGEINDELAITHYQKALTLGNVYAGYALLQRYLYMLDAPKVSGKKVAEYIERMEKVCCRLSELPGVSMDNLVQLKDVDLFEKLECIRIFSAKGRGGFVRLNNTMVAISKERAVPKNDKIEALLELLSQPMDSINVVTLIHNISHLFVSIGSQRNNIRRYLSELGPFFTKIAQHIIALKSDDAARALYKLSLLGLQLDSEGVAHCVTCMVDNLVASEDLSLQAICDFLAGVARFGMVLNEQQQKQIVISVRKKLDEFTFMQSSRMLHALALMDVVSPNGKAIFSLCRRLYDRIQQSDVPHNNLACQHQLLMATHYFKSKYPQAEYLQFETSNQDDIVKSIQSEVSISRLQSRVVLALKQMGWRLKEEVVINGLLSVDIVLEDKRIIQVNGPTHYFHAQSRDCQLSPTDRFHDAVIGSAVIHLPYFDLDPLESNEALSKYLTKKIGRPDLCSSSSNDVGVFRSQPSNIIPGEDKKSSSIQKVI